MIEQKTRRELRDFSDGKCYCSFCRERSPELEKEYNSVWLRASDVELVEDEFREAIPKEIFNILEGQSGLSHKDKFELHKKICLMLGDYFFKLSSCKSSSGQENSPNSIPVLDEHREAGGGCKEDASISFRSLSPVHITKNDDGTEDICIDYSKKKCKRCKKVRKVDNSGLCMDCWLGFGGN